MLTLKNLVITVKVKYEIDGREITETWTEAGEDATPEIIIKRIWACKRYPDNAKISLFY